MALLALDTARLEAGRLDLLPCLALPYPSSSHKRGGRVRGRGGSGGGAQALRSRNYGGIDPLAEKELEEAEEPLLQVRGAGEEGGRGAPVAGEGGRGGGRRPNNYTPYFEIHLPYPPLRLQPPRDDWLRNPLCSAAFTGTCALCTLRCC